MNIQKITKTHLFPKGFTLIELIVVITILAILGTIGFLSIGGYSSKARDSSRISDVANISKSLDVSIITVGTYPTPDNSFAVTYSGGTIWNQGTISTNVLQALRTSIAGGGLSKKPIDPLDNSEYEYSSLAFGKAYQIKAEYEGDLNQTAWNIDSSNTRASLTSLSTSPTSSTLASLLASSLTTPSLIEEAKAAPGAPSIAYIKGNYGGLIARTITGSYTYILAIPSIMTSTGTTSGNKIEITTANALSGTLLFNGKSLKNASAFNPNLTPVFSGSGKVLTTSAEITTLMTNLKNTYTSSGTPDVLANTNIASLIAMNTGSLTTLGSNLVKNDLGITDGSGGGSTDTTTNACSPGTYSATGNAPCTSANPGRYVSSTWATSQTTTTAGYYTSSTGATTQTQCTAGYYCSAGSTTATQTICPVNNYCPAGSGSPVACTVGYISSIGSTNSSSCTLNTYVWEGATWLRTPGNQSSMTITQAKNRCSSIGLTLATATTWGGYFGSLSIWWTHSSSSWYVGNPSWLPTTEAATMGWFDTSGNSLWSAYSPSYWWSSWCTWVSSDSSTIASSSCSSSSTWTSHSALWIACK